MAPSILLLDCTDELHEKLKRQGFDVAQGTIGFFNGERKLPSQVYEKEVFIYNPNPVRKITREDLHSVEDLTPDYDLGYLNSHISDHGATFLIFVNQVSDESWAEDKAYGWIPFMPDILPTSDTKTIIGNFSQNYSHLAPLVLPGDIKLPVTQKIEAPRPTQYVYPPNVMPLLLNKNGDVLGVYIRIGAGQLIILPEYKNNEDIISAFLNRVLPKIYELETRLSLVEKFRSPEENKIYSKIEEVETALKVLGENLEVHKEELANAIRIKIQMIQSDETARLIINYYDLATQQEEVALFYLYKVIEALENKLGGEKGAKTILGCNEEWNLIGRLANESYADIRHAPKPGEKTKEWSQEDIEKCFGAAEKIIESYLGTLF